MIEVLIKKAKEMIKRDLINPSEGGFYDVDGEVVRLEKKSGRTVISCSCKSCSRFCNDFNLCSRKIAVILFEAQDFRLKQKIREIKEHAEKSKELGISIDPSYLNSISDDLKRFIV